MKPGRELDLLVAEKVMGYEIHKPTESIWLPNLYGKELGDFSQCPQYSTAIVAAWEVVEKMKAEWIIVGIEWNHQGWHSYVHPKTGEGHWSDYPMESAPHAICLAALKAKGVEN